MSEGNELARNQFRNIIILDGHGSNRKDQGYPDFDADKANRYFERVVTKRTQLVRDVIVTWDQNGL